MIAVDAAARPSAAQVARTLDQMTARPPRTWVSLSFAVALLLLIYSLVLTVRAPRQARYAGGLFTTFPGSELTPSLFPDTSKVAYAWDGPRRDNFDIYVQRLDGGPPARLTTDPAVDFSPACSPDHAWIAFLRQQPGGKCLVMLAPAEGGPERLLAEIQVQPSIHLRSLDWSRDSRWVVFSDVAENTRLRSLYAVSIETGQRRQLTKTERDHHCLPAVSHDGKTLAFIVDRESIGQIALLSLDASFRPKGEPAVLSLAGFQGFLCLNPRWLNDHELLFTSNKGGNDRTWTVRLSGLRAAAPPTRTSGLEEEANTVDVSRSGDIVVYSRRVADSNMYRLRLSPDPGKAAEPHALLGSSRQERNPQISPDGSRVAFESDRSAYPEIWISDRDGGNAFAVTDFRGPVTGSPRWMPDGQSVVFDTRVDVAPEIYMAAAKPNSKLRNVTQHQASDILPAVSPDGDWI
jgi:Tol biopolymer transport system component